MNKYTLTIALGLIVAACANAQLSQTDRNFQRLDLVQAKKADHKAGAISQELAANVTFPDTMFGIGASYKYLQLGDDSGMGTILSTTSYFHMNPSGVGISDMYSETASYQLLGDKIFAPTLGIIAATDTDGVNAFEPYLALSYSLFNSFTLIPSGSYIHQYGNGGLNDGWIPDVMLTYSPSFFRNVVGFADWTIPTTSEGQGGVQLGFGTPILKSWDLKFAASVSQGADPLYAAMLGYKF